MHSIGHQPFIAVADRLGDDRGRFSLAAAVLRIVVGCLALAITTFASVLLLLALVRLRFALADNRRINSIYSIGGGFD